MMENYRSIPLEVLRDFVRTQCATSTIRAVAAKTGLGRSTVHKFITGRITPHSRSRRVLEWWFIENH